VATIPLRRALLLLAGLALGAGAARGEPPPADDDDVMGGFDAGDFPSAGSEPAEAERRPRWWDLTGSVALALVTSYPEHDSPTGTDYQGLLGLRTRLDLQLDFELPCEWKARAAGFGFYDFAYLANGRSEYTQEVLNSYEWDVDSGEVWIEGPLLSSLDLKLGRQVVNWGRSDTLRVLDVLNPLDNREPGLLDIEDLRRPVGMAKLAWYPLEHWSVTGIVIPELRFDKDPPFGSDFFPSAVPPPPERRPQSFRDTPEWAASLSGIFEGWDVSFHYADYYDEQARLATAPMLPGGLRLRHSRIRLGGVGGNYTFGSWLVKAEFAYLTGIDYWATGEKDRIDAMVGLEYYGIPENSFAIEVVNRHIDDWEGALLETPDSVRRDSIEYSLRWSADWWNARLHTTALVVVFGEQAQDGTVVRMSLDYDVRDALVLSVGIQIFLEGTHENGLLDPIADNDRVMARLKYSF
jgi:hypothetical protein